MVCTPFETLVVSSLCLYITMVVSELCPLTTLAITFLVPFHWYLVANVLLLVVNVPQW